MNFLKHQNGYLLEGHPANVAVLPDGSTWDVPRGWTATDYPGHVIDATPDLYDTERFTAVNWTVEQRRGKYYAVPTLVSKSGEALEADVLAAVEAVKTEYAAAQRAVRVKQVEQMIVQRLKEVDKTPNSDQLAALPGLASAALDEIEGT